MEVESSHCSILERDPVSDRDPGKDGQEAQTAAVDRMIVEALEAEHYSGAVAPA